MKPGDWVVYTKPKFGVTPGPRAKDVAPNRHGEGYSYVVEKYWVVSDSLPGGQLKLRTRRGKEHVVRADDSNLRQARWWERWYFRERFRSIQSVQADHVSADRTSADTRAATG